MGEAAVAAARAIDYVGAGTVEFLLDDDGRFYFLEMNTRLQVEHPVTELVTGLDLVAWQLAVADGQPLPLTQDAVTLDGHAIEARLYAEDPWAGFLPQVGHVLAWRPATGAGVRIDAGICTGQTITPYYDPMVAKVIAHGPTREVARRRLVAALRASVLLGPTTNRRFLIDVLQSDAFVSASIKTDALDRMDLSARPQPSAAAWALAAVLRSRGSVSAAEVDAWRPTSAAAWPVTLVLDERRRTSWVESIGRGRYRVRHDDESPQAHELVLVAETAAGEVEVEIDGVRRHVSAITTDHGVIVDVDAAAFGFEEPSTRSAGAAEAGDGQMRAPMGGRVVRVEVAPGDAVDRGQCVAVVEAMKLEHRVTASAAGTVVTVAVAAGDQVAARQVLATLEVTSPQES
jgi:geranyl-CoA carboxylase alpha subunit